MVPVMAALVVAGGRTLKGSRIERRLRPPRAHQARVNDGNDDTHEHRLNGGPCQVHRQIRVGNRFGQGGGPDTGQDQEVQ